MDGKTPMTPRPQRSTSSQDREVGALIARLLLHFWTPQELSQEARALMAQDWVMDLKEFGPEAVAIACGEWRRNNSKRPAIADIRALAIEWKRESEWEPGYRPDPVALQERRERRARECRDMQLAGRAAINAWAQENGHADVDAMAEARGCDWSDVYVMGMKDLMARAVAAAGRQPVKGFASGAAMFGVTAREVEEPPTPSYTPYRD